MAFFVRETGCRAGLEAKGEAAVPGRTSAVALARFLRSIFPLRPAFGLPVLDAESLSEDQCRDLGLKDGRANYRPDDFPVA